MNHSMTIRKLFFMVLMGAILALTASAQDLTQAKKAFDGGKYDDAKKLYETAASLMKDKAQRDDVYTLAKKCTACKNKLAEADRLFKNHNYSAASRAYKELLTMNPKDPTAKSKVAQIPQLLEKDKLDDTRWAEIESNPSYDKYKEYVSEFPNGKHLADARAYIKSVDEQRKEQEQAEAKERERVEGLRRQEEAAYRAFVSNRQVQSGLDYLAQYPAGEYVTQVKDRLVELYCDRHEYTKARQYAEGSEKKAYVQTHEREYEKEQNAKAEESAFVQFDKNRTEASARAFLDKYRNGYHSEEVSRWLVDALCRNNSYTQAKQYAVNDDLKWIVESKEEEYAFNVLKGARSLTGEKNYLASYPGGKYVDQVKEWYVRDLIKENRFDDARQYANSAEQLSLIAQAEEKQVYDDYKARPSLFWGKAYLEKYPDGEHNLEVREKVVKELCEDGEFGDAAYFAAPSDRLTNYVNAERASAMKLKNVERKKVERAEAFDGFASHFLDFTIGYHEQKGMLWGGMYAFVPKRLGFYLGGEYIEESYSVFAGPVLRLFKDSSGLDMQFYGGAGINSEIPLVFEETRFSELPLVFDAGVRLGIRQTKFSVMDICLGTRMYQGTQFYYAGVSVALPFIFILAL